VPPASLKALAHCQLCDNENMQDNDGGLQKARAAHVDEQSRRDHEQQLLREKQQAEQQRIRRAGKAFVEAVRSESLELRMSQRGYLVDSGKTCLQEGMYRPWEVVVSLEGDVLLVQDSRTPEDVLSHYEAIFSPGYQPDPNEKMAELQRIADLVIERLAR